jgi:hypothetical protein
MGPFVSVFVKYGQNAPSGRLNVLSTLGSRVAGDIARRKVIAAEVPPGAVERLKRLPWVRSVEVGNDDNRPEEELVPWGVDSIDADVVHSAGNLATGIKVGIMDGGLNCWHTDLMPNYVSPYGYDFVEMRPYQFTPPTRRTTPPVGATWTTTEQAWQALLRLRGETGWRWLGWRRMRICSRCGCARPVGARTPGSLWPWTMQ